MTSAETPDEPLRSAVARLPLCRVVLASGLGAAFFFRCESWGAPADGARAAALLAMYGIPLAWWLASARRRGWSLSDVMGERPAGQHFVLAVVASSAVLGVRVGWITLLTELDAIPDYWEIAQPDDAGPMSTWTRYLISVVLAPVVEEVLFRGVIFHRLLRYMSPVAAALGSSLLFGLGHVDIVGSALVGAVFLVAYVRTGSLWVPIAMHSLVGLIALGPWLDTLVSLRESSPWVLVVLQLICVPWVVWFLRGPYRLTTRAPSTGAHA